MRSLVSSLKLEPGPTGGSRVAHGTTTLDRHGGWSRTGAVPRRMTWGLELAFWIAWNHGGISLRKNGLRLEEQAIRR